MFVRGISQAGAGSIALLLSIGCSAISSSAEATDAPPLVLEHLTTAEGLPQATVMTTLQDPQGFVWIGTEDGLVRFDGRELYRYAHSRTQRNSLSGNFIWEIAEDGARDLWIAIKDGGIAHWNRATDRFESYRHDAKRPDSLASDSVRTLVVDHNGLVWIGTSDAGLDVLDPKSGKVRHLHHDPSDAASLSSDNVFTLSLARNGDVWVGTNSGLDRWLNAGRSLTHFGPPAHAPGSLRGKQISKVVEDDHGSIWVGTYDAGLVHLDRDGRLLESFTHDSTRPDSLTTNDVRALLEDQAGRLWIGTTDGLNLLERPSGGFTHFRHEESNADSLRDSYIMSLYEDQAGLVWIGTRTGGVSRWNPRSWEFGGHRPTWLGSGAVMAFADAADDRVWIASFEAGLAQFNPRTNELVPIDTLLGQRNALGNARVMSLRQDHSGNLWIGTMTSGLMKLGSRGLEKLAVGADAHATSAAGIMSITESRDGRLWIGTFGGGANVLDPATGRVRQLPFGDAQGAVSAANVTSIAEDAHGNLWIGTEGGGLNLANADGTVRKVFRHDPRDATSFPANTIYALVVDAEDHVWAGTDGGGLVRIVGSATAPDSLRFEVLTRNDGLSSDTLYGIVPDAAGNLWLSGTAGLMRFNPKTHAIKTFHREHGLQGEEFSFGAYYRLGDGMLCFGGPGGFNIFDPTRLTENRQPPRLALTNIEVLGIKAKTPHPYWRTDHVALDYRGSIVSFDFGVLDFNSPQYNRLAYRMTDLTDRWIDVGAQRRITLTNLASGDHVLEVRAATSDSAWSTEPLRIIVHRDPAPWASRWAYATYALVALGLLFYRMQRQRRKYREMAAARARLESEVALRTRELRESNEQLAEAARAKSDFLDRMSHELRTPMNGVVGMTELLSRTSLSAAQTHLTKTIRSSAQILLQIVNDLLDLSKIRAGKVALESLPVDLGQVLEECTSLFAGAAQSKGIELVVCPPPRLEHTLLGDPLRVRQIVMNLVGNAVKFTAQGEVAVRADIASIEGDDVIVSIAVADTGVGMDAAAMNRIFEPFSQADETTTRKFGGTGLGLTICRELADIMHGRITVQSQPQIGSTFTLSLPMKKGVASTANDVAASPMRLRILTRRSSLYEALSRHAASLGFTTVEETASDVAILDVSTQRDELQTLLAGASVPATLVVIATAAEVESLDLRIALDESRIVLKPVHRIALQDALAAATGRLQTTALRSASPAQPRFQGHVLLVEDEPVNAAVAEGYLQALGCTSVWVANSADAVARCQTERFDLIFMDLNMPDKDGFATTALIRRSEHPERRVPIIALTAHEASSFRDRCRNADMDDILSKPYSLDDCARMLQRWLTPAAASMPSTPPVAKLSPAASLTSIDDGAVQALRNLRGQQNTDLYSRLVTLYRSGSADSLAKLRAAVTAENWAEAAAVCHKFAAAAANVGALEYAKEVRRLEQLCRAGDRSSAIELHETLQAAHAALLDALSLLTMKASA